MIFHRWQKSENSALRIGILTSIMPASRAIQLILNISLCQLMSAKEVDISEP